MLLTDMHTARTSITFLSSSKLRLYLSLGDVENLADHTICLRERSSSRPLLLSNGRLAGDAAHTLFHAKRSIISLPQRSCDRILSGSINDPVGQLGWGPKMLHASFQGR